MNERPDQAAQRSTRSSTDWWVYHGAGRPLHDAGLDQLLPDPPPWRTYTGVVPENDNPPEDDGEMERRLGPVDRMRAYRSDPDELNMVNSALFLRRPLLVTGPPGVGKSTLAFQIARELRLGRVLRWHITSFMTLKSGLYNYDAIGRAQAAAAARTVPEAAIEIGDESLGDYVRLGPLGTAFLPSRLPRVLLIDELDKSEADLPNDLLGIFEDGGFPIPELERVRATMAEVTVGTDDPDRQAVITGGRVRCHGFPVVVITSNGERDFPPAFLRRCLQLDIKPPSEEKLAEMVIAQFGDIQEEQRNELIRQFVRTVEQEGAVPADRLLDAMYLVKSGEHDPTAESWGKLRDALWRRLNAAV